MMVGYFAHAQASSLGSSPGGRDDTAPRRRAELRAFLAIGGLAPKSVSGATELGDLKLLIRRGCQPDTFAVDAYIHNEYRHITT